MTTSPARFGTKYTAGFDCSNRQPVTRGRFPLVSRRGLKHCNGGHEPLILLRRGEIIELDVGGLAFGIDPDFHYEWAEQALELGDLLILVTDGMTETLNYDGESYGRQRLHASIKLHGSMAPDLPRS